MDQAGTQHEHDVGHHLAVVIAGLLRAQCDVIQARAA